MVKINCSLPVLSKQCHVREKIRIAQFWLVVRCCQGKEHKTEQLTICTIRKTKEHVISCEENQMGFSFKYINQNSTSCLSIAPMIPTCFHLTAFYFQ